VHLCGCILHHMAAAVDHGGGGCSFDWSLAAKLTIKMGGPGLFEKTASLGMCSGYPQRPLCCGKVLSCGILAC
jgi:hypothetical protein